MDKKRLTRRDFLRMSALTAAGMALAGCKATPKETPEPTPVPTVDKSELTGEFVFAWAGEGQAELVDYAGSHTGADVDKFADFDIPTAPAAVVHVPLLAEAVANLECKLHSATPAGDHTIFIGQVVAAHLPDEPIAKLDNFAGTYAVARPGDA